ncbi:MAG: hypothetical protein JO223_09935, partial [Hyphomicrobiales bacterium]|nr:hypothetical protein [Hyphomicrobiales bacterium]
MAGGGQFEGRVAAIRGAVVDDLSALQGEIHALRAIRRRFDPLSSSLFLIVLISNWSPLIPDVDPPTAHIETDAAMALIVFVA